MWVSETSNNIPSEVFLYQTIPGVPLRDTELSEMFVAVCTYGDVDQFSTNRPTDAGTLFYRKSGLDLLFKSESEAEKYRRTILKMVKQAVADICRVNSLEPAEVSEVNL